MPEPSGASVVPEFDLSPSCSHAWPPGPGLGGSCPPEDLSSHEVSTAYAMMPSAAHTAQAARANIRDESKRKAAAMKAAVMSRQMPDLTGALASGRRRTGAGARAGLATAGMSAVSAARSA